MYLAETNVPLEAEDCVLSDGQWFMVMPLAADEIEDQDEGFVWVQDSDGEERQLSLDSIETIERFGIVCGTCLSTYACVCPNRPQQPSLV